jgi:hypothetical protein
MICFELEWWGEANFGAGERKDREKKSNRKVEWWHDPLRRMYPVLPELKCSFSHGAEQMLRSEESRSLQAEEECWKTPP